MENKSESLKKAARVLEILLSRYGERKSQLEYSSPWELLVATILAAQCTDARVNKITPEFFKRWPGPAELACADIADIENVIHSAGFFHNKARNLSGCAVMVRDVFNNKLPESMEELLRLPGVARKTANCVLYAGFGINAGLAVDTHVKRISYRLGLTIHTDPVKIEKDLMELFPQDSWGIVNNHMVWFGRDVCKAAKPDCTGCEMRVFCPSSQ